MEWVSESHANEQVSKNPSANFINLLIYLLICLFVCLFVGSVELLHIPQQQNSVSITIASFASPTPFYFYWFVELPLHKVV